MQCMTFDSWFEKLVLLEWRLAQHDYFRACGDVVCMICGRIYYDHPQLYDYTETPPEFTGLWLLCNGDLVHL